MCNELTELVTATCVMAYGAMLHQWRVNVTLFRYDRLSDRTQSLAPDGRNFKHFWAVYAKNHFLKLKKKKRNFETL